MGRSSEWPSAMRLECLRKPCLQSRSAGTMARSRDLLRRFRTTRFRTGLSAGQVTDDTEQALMLARRLVLGRGRIDEDLLAQDLLEWEADVKARGLRDLLGPSSKAALDAMLAGSPVTETGRNGTTNGAAMRIAPIGIAVVAEPMLEFVDQVELACRMTHNTGEAIAAAAAVAAVISCGVEGSSFEGALPVALKAAEVGQSRGYPVGGRRHRKADFHGTVLCEGGGRNR